MDNKNNDSWEPTGERPLDDWDPTALLQKITGVVPSIIYVFNQQTQSNEYSNRSIGAAMGYSPVEIHAMGAALMPMLAHPDDLPKIGAHFEAIQQLDDGEVVQIEYRMKHKAGHWVWLLSHDTVFDRDQNGQVLRHIGVASDISAQKAAEIVALEQKLAADTASEELRSFAYSISHDLKAPSNSLQLILSELHSEHRNSFNDDAAELIDLSMRTVSRMQDLVDDVLRYTRVMGEPLKSETVSLSSVMEDVIEDCRADIEKSGAELQIAKLSDVQGSPTHLRILFQNLIGNALKYNKPGVAPKVEVSEHSTGDGRVSVVIRDHGIGIASEYFNRIFVMFKRLHRIDEYPGNGLGLAICRRIAIQHGGDITVWSEEGVGSAFTVSLKL